MSDHSHSSPTQDLEPRQQFLGCRFACRCASEVLCLACIILDVEDAVRLARRVVLFEYMKQQTVC